MHKRIWTPIQDVDHNYVDERIRLGEPSKAVAHLIEVDCDVDRYISNWYNHNKYDCIILGSTTLDSNRGYELQVDLSHLKDNIFYTIIIIHKDVCIELPELTTYDKIYLLKDNIKYTICNCILDDINKRLHGDEYEIKMRWMIGTLNILE